VGNVFGRLLCYVPQRQMAHWMDVNKTGPDVRWKAVLETACSGMARIVGGRNALISLAGYSILRTLVLSKNKNFVRRRYFTQSRDRNLELRNHWFGNLAHVVSGMGFVEQFCEHSPRTALDLLSPHRWSMTTWYSTLPETCEWSRTAQLMMYDVDATLFEWGQLGNRRKCSNSACQFPSQVPHNRQMLAYSSFMNCLL